MSPFVHLSKIKKKLKNSDVRRAKIIALAFNNNGHLLSFSTNKVIMGHPRKWTIHAEEGLIKKLIKLRAKERFGKIDILIMRWCKTKKWTNAKPCSKCMKAMNKYGIDEIYYTNENGKIVGLF